MAHSRTVFRTRFAGLVVALLAVACGKDPVRPPAAAAIAAVSPISFTSSVGGQPTTLIVQVLDAENDPVAGAEVTFQVSGPGAVSPASARTDQAGRATTQVTFTAAGSIEVVASVAGLGQSVRFTGSATGSGCTGAPTSLAVGQVVPDAGSAICIGGAANSEFVAIVVNTSLNGDATASIELAATGISPVTSSTSLADAGASGNLWTHFAARRRTRDQAAEQRFREEDVELIRRLGPGAAERRARSAAQSTIPGNAAIGSIHTLNLEQQRTACSAISNRGVRVAAVSSKAIILVDTLNPPGGYTDAQFDSIAVTFDTLVHPVDVANFGEPSDLDNNGRVLIIFTRTINELTPAGSQSFVGGRTTSRDLFSTADCEGSNVGEMFYMLTPDPDGVVNGNKFQKDDPEINPITTIAHEYQHLINFSRRIYVLRQPGNTWVEKVWMHEGLSHMAEELVFYKASGLAPRSNLTLATLRQVDAIPEFNNYLLGNFFLYDGFLRSPETNSPYQGQDNVEMRGAIWSLLRYAADRYRPSDGNLWFQLVNANNTGMPNLMARLGLDSASMSGTIRDWAISTYVDDFVAGVPPVYTQPSWNMRSLYAGFNSASFTFPLRAPTSLTAGQPLTLSLKGGAFTVRRFSVAAGGVGTLTFTAATAGPKLAIVRVR